MNAVLFIVKFSSGNPLDESELAKKIVHRWEEGWCNDINFSIATKHANFSLLDTV